MTLVDDRPSTLRTVQLELTGRCPLACQHCLTSSSPTTAHGSMTPADWLDVVDQVAAAGTPTVQLIGGEPTASPAFGRVLERALGLGRQVEVFSNLHFPAQLWPVLDRPGVTLATSYYDTDPTVHDRVTGRAGSHARTRARIVEALARHVPIRVEIIEVIDGQNLDATRAELLGLGLPADRIHVDRTRLVGRAAGGEAFDPGELCGRCGHGKAAVLPDGTLAPCVMARALAAGDVRTAPLAELLTREVWRAAVAAVPPRASSGCSPDDSACGPDSEACGPDYPEVGA
ncbi:radical SAM protein [Pseudofrankia inefficax]|uniref:Radical SAM domain protein n=1 Tax=Pseudofrankia inefficax (strain DSM 45817 / CECT 9037 / DDB 130130 / EuI1c) TaxID=298654 RepID=E3J662_PSEI1|nr:radical SAM protein [Pseudofrankia inefficax]ADP78353.1 Radical SAM domain protein [Pseudofrankia inefficax]